MLARNKNVINFPVEDFFVTDTALHQLLYSPTGGAGSETCFVCILNCLNPDNTPLNHLLIFLRNNNVLHVTEIDTDGFAEMNTQGIS